MDNLGLNLKTTNRQQVEEVPYGDIRMPERFWSKVVVHDGCWLWASPPTLTGYGQFYYQGKKMLAHRASYLGFLGELDEKLTIDHLCKNTLCVNPIHLEQISRAENNRRAFMLKDRCRSGKHDWIIGQSRCHPCRIESRSKKTISTCPVCNKDISYKNISRHIKTHKLDIRKDSFWDYVEKIDGGCWNRIRGIRRTGYSEFNKRPAHRYAYEQLVGRITDGLVLDHTCNNKRCVNPAHLEPVTRSVNTKRHYERISNG